LIAVLGLLMTAAIASVISAQTVIDVANPVSGNGYTVSNGVIMITSNGEYTLQGTTETNKVVVAQGVTATVTLENVSIRPRPPRCLNPMPITAT